MDGPFAHVNPFDGETEYQLSIVGGPDTIRIANVVQIYQLVTVPVVNGYRANWSSSAPTVFRSLGDGRFVLSDVPTATLPVQVKVSFIGVNEAVRNVVILGAP